MPVFRNIRRQSGRLGKQTAVFYDKDGWPILDDVEDGRDTDGCSSSEARSPSPSRPSSISIPKLPDSVMAYYRGNPANDHSEKPQPKSTSRPSSRRGRSHSSSGTSASSYSTAPYSIQSRPRKKNQKEGHIPRPPNGFLMFRSHYMRINSMSEANKYQTNLSKNAGIVWNKMTAAQQGPYYLLADIAKEEHRIKYPNYCYAPKGLGSKSRSKPKPRSTAAPTAAEQLKPRPTRSVAKRAVRRRVVFTPSPSPTPSLGECSEIECDGEVVIKQEDADEFIPTSEIPVLELSPPPAKEKGPEPVFDLSVRPPHLDRIPEQFGVKPYVALSAMETFLPPLPGPHRGGSLMGPLNLDWDFTDDLPVRDGTFNARFQLGVESLLTSCDSPDPECLSSPAFSDTDMLEMTRYFDFELCSI